jgi:LCP family protein required for cell wall assembly
MKRNLVFVALAAIAVAVVFSSTGRDDEPSKMPPAIELHRTAAASYFDPVKRSPLFVLVIGSDVREGDPRGGRADSLHLVSINTKTGAGTIIGIPRDSYVPIPGSGTNKINASLFFGGPERTVQTVSQLAKVPIHYWALIEFSRFRSLVDQLGGIEVDVPYAMNDKASGAVFPKGLRKMNGDEALAFSRNRKTVPGGDFGRSENQGRVLLAALKKFQKDTKSPLQLAKYLLSFRSFVSSDVGAGDLLKLARIGRKMKLSAVSNHVIPGSGGSAGGASIVNLGPGAEVLFAKIRDDGVL